MKKVAMKDFVDIFGLKNDTFGTQGSVDKVHFVDSLEHVSVDFSKFEVAKHMMIAMMALTPDDDDQEKEAILAALN